MSAQQSVCGECGARDGFHWDHCARRNEVNLPVPVRTGSVGSGEDEARRAAIGKTIGNVLHRMHPTDGDRVTLLFEDGGALQLTAEGRIAVTWEPDLPLDL